MSTASELESYPNLSKVGVRGFRKVVEDSKFLRITFRKSSDFISDTMTQVPLNRAEGIMVIVGIVKAKKMQCSVAAVRFPKSKFSTEQAQKWLVENFSINKD